MSLQHTIPYTPEARALSKTLRKNMTAAEKVFWEKVRKKQVGIQVFRQFPILDYVVDFYIKEIGLAIEIDGTSHQNRILEDSHRQERIEKLGIQFIRFTNEQILQEIDSVVKEVQDTIDLLNQE